MQKKTAQPLKNAAASAPEGSEPEKQALAEEQEKKEMQQMRELGRARYGEAWMPLEAQDVRAVLEDASATGAKVFLHASEESVARMLRHYFFPQLYCCEHSVQGGVCFCRIGGYDPHSDRVIMRSACGSAAKNGFEPEKSAAGDAFKRAARMWGAGAELFDLPKIAIPRENCDTDASGRIFTNVYAVETLRHDRYGRICAFTLCSRGGKTFTWVRDGAEK